MTLHYTSGGHGAAIAAAGFDLADVQYVAQLNELPAGQMGLVWLGEKDGATEAFRAKVRPFVGNKKLFGFHLWDEPDITGRYHAKVDPANLKAESDWIHDNVPGAKTFVTLMDMGPFDAPSFKNTFNHQNTNIDLYGISAYPIRVKSADLSYIDRTFAAARASGLALSQIVPIFQAFGGGSWRSNTGDAYVLPTPAQARQMFDRWARLVPDPVFDFAYGWSSQSGDTKLDSSAAASLRAAHLAHNTETEQPPAEPPPPASPHVVKLRAFADQIQAGTLKPVSGSLYLPSDGSVLLVK